MLTNLNRSSVAMLTNKSGGARAYGDVVVIDTVTASSFTTTTTSGYVSEPIGVVIDPNGIVNNATGAVVITAGYLPKINLNTAATVGQLIKTHTVAGQGTPHSTPFQVGDFAVALTASATPEAIIFPVTLAIGAGTPDTGWSVSNVTTDKVYDANSTTVNELADVLGTLITTLISKGILSA